MYFLQLRLTAEVLELLSGSPAFVPSLPGGGASATRQDLAQHHADRHAHTRAALPHTTGRR